jgi:hypothetical protein
MRKWLKILGLAVTLALSHLTIASAYYPYGSCTGSCDAGDFTVFNVTMNQCCSGQFQCPGGGTALYYYWVPSYPADVVWCP